MALNAAGAAHGPRLGGPGFSCDELPPGRFRTAMNNLSPVARHNAEAWLQRFTFPTEDLESMRIDREGGIYYADTQLPHEAEEAATVPPQTLAVPAPLPVSPFPGDLKFHSRPGAPNVLYIDFDGENVSGTAWNGTLSRDTIPAIAFTLDGDLSTFSGDEQLAIKRIWQRVAEDYAPFDIDVTTDPPVTFDRRTAHALVTRNTDADGEANPSSGGGGVAYVDVFGSLSYAYYRPAWIYYNNLSSREYYISEAVSHEIGHNMGLSHDGKTDGTVYYAGHGAGDTSWAPIMGGSYNRNVTTWSKGEYYLANNSEDDLAILAAKLGYRMDDHGDTSASATFLTVVDGIISATTPETDPDNTNPRNKGVIERNTERDMFTFVAASGPVMLAIQPWVSPAAYRGGNLDILARLYDAAGQLLHESSFPDRTGALIQTTVTEGQYYLEISGTGAGDPLAATPSGYTPYASLGQYFVTGRVSEATGVVIPPRAELAVNDIILPGRTDHTFVVTYTDDAGIDVSTIDDTDLVVTGPGGYEQMATRVSVDPGTDGTPRMATYSILPPTGTWTPAANGTYSVTILSNRVADVEGAFVRQTTLGLFACAVPSRTYIADMSTDPGWTLAGAWEYGAPLGNAGDPSSAYSGTYVVGYNLAGTYARRSDMMFASTPSIDCSDSGVVSLQFKRWLGLTSGDTAVIDVSADGTTWTTVWSTSGDMNDGRWTTVQHDLSAVAARQPNVYVRWGLKSNADKHLSYGWNLDDVEVLGDGALDTRPPGASLTAANILEGGNPSYTFSVTYTDDTAVAVSSLGDTNVLVTGPNAYSNLAAFVGVDDMSDGTPRTATYRISAPGGAWEPGANGTYTVSLVDNRVADTTANAAAGRVLGTFLVDIRPMWRLSVAVNNPAWGQATPGDGIYRDGTEVNITAMANTFYHFDAWRGDVTGSQDSVRLVMDSDKNLLASFAELMTTNFPTPHWWLAEQGYTSDLENVVMDVGDNTMPLYASYVAGLDPGDPESTFEVKAERLPLGGLALRWSAVSGRVYAVHGRASFGEPFLPVPGATALPWTQNVHEVSSPGFYRITVRKAE